MPGLDAGPKVKIVRLSTVKPRPLRPLWSRRFYSGKTSLVSGDPSLGKSLITIDMAARVSRGTPWPDLRNEGIEPGGVVVLSAEDDIDDTICPWLHAAGADLNRIVAIQGIEFRDADRGAKRIRSFNFEQHLPALEGAIRDVEDCRLVVVDPISAFLGKIDSHRNSDVRGILAGLSELRREYLEFTESIWHKIQSRVRSYPRYEEFQRLLAFDYRQLMNVMRYSFLINRQPALINLTEHNLYMPHNMHMMVSGTMDLMVSPDIDRRDLGPLREILWHAQEMGRIGNVVTTGEREIREGDLSSGVFAVGRAEGVLDLEDFRREHPQRLAGKIRAGDLESRFLERWSQLRGKILQKATEVHTVDVGRIVDGLDRLLRLHLSSRGLK